MRVLIPAAQDLSDRIPARSCCRARDEAFVLDNLSTGSIDNIIHLKDCLCFHYTIDTIGNEAVLAELIDPCDVVVHLAAAVGSETDRRTSGAHHRDQRSWDRSRSQAREQEEETRGLLRQPPRSLARAPACRSPRMRTSRARMVRKHPPGMRRGASSIDGIPALSCRKERKLPVIRSRLFNTVEPRHPVNTAPALPQLCKAGVGRAADHHLWRRKPVAQLHLRGGCGARHGSLDQRTPRSRPGLQYRQRQRDNDRVISR